MNKWLLMLTPLLIIVTSFILLSIDIKDPMQVIENAKKSLSKQDYYMLNTTMIVSMNLFESPLTYFYNMTTIFDKGNYHTILVSQTPFTAEFIIYEQFITKEGNYTCTNSYSKPVCYNGAELAGQAPINYSSIDYLGSKKVNGRQCSAILFNMSANDLPKELLLNKSFTEEVKSKGYYCYDQQTGLAIESLTTVESQSMIQGMIMDVGVNITSYLTGISLVKTESDWSLPYELITDEELDLMANEQADQPSQGL